MKIFAAAHDATRLRTGGRLSVAVLSAFTMLIPQTPATGIAEAELACPYAQIVSLAGRSNSQVWVRPGKHLSTP